MPVILWKHIEMTSTEATLSGLYLAASAYDLFNELYTYLHCTILLFMNITVQFLDGY